MKKLLLASFVLLTSIAFGQLPKIKDGVFYTTLSSGAGVDVSISFSIGNVDKIKESEEYKTFLKDNDYINTWTKKGVKDTLTIFLMNQVNFVGEMTKLKLTNSTSFTPIENSKGYILIDNDKLSIMFPFKAQNGLGNMVASKSLTEGSETTILEN
jgi:hypothetical protein